MCALSNPPPAGDGADPSGGNPPTMANHLARGAVSPERPFQIRKAADDDLNAAISAILGFWGHATGRPAVDEFIRAAPSRGIDLANLWLADQSGNVLWAVLPVLSPGRTMLLFVPGKIPSPPIAAALLHAVCVAHANCDVHLAQLLLESGTASLRQFLKLQEFTHMADLIYLQTTPPPDIAVPPTPTGCTLNTYSADNHDQFAHAILRTYEGSLDCPGLNGLRTIEDIIAGHKATGEFNPATWFLLTRASPDAEPPTPLGVLLLSHVTHTDALELVYLGLTPEARGCGLGHFMMRLALATAVRSDLRRLTLAVDSTNAPALRLYYAHGMQRLTARAAFLRDLKPLKTND